MGAFAPPPRAGSAATSAAAPAAAGTGAAGAPGTAAIVGGARCCALIVGQLRHRAATYAPVWLRRPSPLAAKMEVENQHNLSPLFLLSLFSSGMNLGLLGMSKRTRVSGFCFIFDLSLNSILPEFAWAKHSLSISGL